jgi:Ser/Thr protein kinase RdoA (MazF antagonist)
MVCMASRETIAYDSLDRRGQLRRMRAVAVAALDRYDLSVMQLALLRAGWNTFFRIDTPEEQRYVLRIGAPFWRSLIDVRSELAWIAALRRDTDLRVVEPVPARDGEIVTTVDEMGVPESLHCVLFRWLPGRAPGRFPSAQMAYKLGDIVARLHDHAATFRPPDPFTRRQHNSVWEFGPPGAIYSDAPHELLSPERRRILRETAALVQAELDDLFADPVGKRFLHMDLHFRNLKVAGGELSVLDFDDSEWGYPVQDVAISLHFMLRLPHYHDLRRAYLEGYKRRRPVPELHTEQIDALMAERQFNIIEVGLSGRFPRAVGWLPGTLETAERLLRRWLDTGTMA